MFQGKPRNKPDSHLNDCRLGMNCCVSSKS
nr:MAG TPA: hypothetical protein [Bacteriophage sp.]